MSRPERPKGGESKKPFSAQFLSDRVDSALILDGDKPDAKGFDHLASPVSPLRTVGGGAAAASSSSSSSGSLSEKPPPNAILSAVKSDAGVRRSHSGELSASNSGSPNRIPGHRRSGSGQMVFSGGAASSSASSPVTNVLPAGNICPSGKIGKTGMMSRSTARKDVLGSGSGFYGHGSIMRGSAAGVAKSPGSGETTEMRNLRSRNVDPAEITKAGNEHYKKGEFVEALKFYDRAVEMCPGNASCWSNRAASFMGLERLKDAVRDFDEAIRLNPSFTKAHLKLSGLYLRLGQIEPAMRHLVLAGEQPDASEMQKLQMAEKYMERCTNARKISDWKSTLREADAVVAAGADSSPLVTSIRAEALLHLRHLDEADSALSKALKYAMKSPPSSQANFLGMLSGSYIWFVQAQVELAKGRFENAVESAEKAHEFDPLNIEVSVMRNNVKSVTKARTQGNEFFKSGYFAEACTAYGEGLKYAPANPVLHCNRAACRSKMGQWERSLEDCNEALRIQPSYTKALLRRAASFAKLERWVEAVRDYEVLRKELPADKEVAEALFHSQVSLKMSRGEEVSNMTFGGEVEQITGPEQFHAAIALPGVSVVYFTAASNQRCFQTTPLIDALCTKYPSLNFLKVDINGSPSIAKQEKVIIVPTVKIYRNGVGVKEMICPSMQVLELSLKHYDI
ncbi:TPR repeat-containing thioredoxin TTL1 [Platanthera zijinensis]|uniref:TPR repeat-containing thioredoxin TTL1 n=1 Tax=Platanthera zijinensis TaxID=2320716 RepID=A0AAP0BSI5_9ASPA